MLDNCGENMVGCQIAGVVREVNSITEMCDAGDPGYGNHLAFGRHSCMFVNLETGETAHFLRENSICCLDFVCSLFQWQGSRTSERTFGEIL